MENAPVGTKVVDKNGAPIHLTVTDPDLVCCVTFFCHKPFLTVSVLHQVSFNRVLKIQSLPMPLNWQLTFSVSTTRDSWLSIKRTWTEIHPVRESSDFRLLPEKSRITEMLQVHPWQLLFFSKTSTTTPQLFKCFRRLQSKLGKEREKSFRYVIIDLTNFQPSCERCNVICICQVEATDNDYGENAVISYSIYHVSNNGRGKFKIDPHTGLLTTSGKLIAGEQYSITVQVGDCTRSERTY